MKRVLIVGAGALGCQCVPELHEQARLLVVDGDSVEEKNLDRQPLYSANDIGKVKVEVLAVLFPGIKADAGFVDMSNASVFVKEADLVLDLADDLHLTKILDKVCAAQKVPLLIASVHREQGQVYLLNSRIIGDDSEPRYADLFRGHIGIDQDGCDMQAVPMETIKAVGRRAVALTRQFIQGDSLNAALNFFDGRQWHLMEVGDQNS